MKPVLKIIIACLASWLFLIALSMTFSGFQILGSEDDSTTTGIAFPLLLAFLACFGVSWVNTRAIGRSFVGGLGGILIGLPLSYLVLVPLGYWLADHLFPLSNLGLSGSLAWGWFLLGIITVVEVLTDRVNQNKRWVMLLVGGGLVMVLIHAIELFVAKSGISNDKSSFLIEVYAPLIWGCVIGITNTRTFKQ